LLRELLELGLRKSFDKSYKLCYTPLQSRSAASHPTPIWANLPSFVQKGSYKGVFPARIRAGGFVAGFVRLLF